MNFHAICCDNFVSRHSLDIDSLMPVATLVGVSTQGPWLVGGSVRRLVTKMPQDSDFDVGLASKNQFDEVSERLMAAGFSAFSETRFHRELRGKLAERDIRIQLLKLKFAGSPQLLLEDFDFTICMCAFDGTQLHFGEFTLWDLGRKRLAINKVTYAASTIRRLLKYGRQGFSVCDGCIQTILTAVAQDPSLIHSDIEYID
jgi:hypothetical protein